jgi:hypothetical protein
MNTKERIEYEMLIEVCKEIDYKLCKLNKACKEPTTDNKAFWYLWGAKNELLNFKDLITEKLAHYRKTIFKTKKNNNYEQTN